MRVSVTSPTAVMGEARLHVDGRASPLQRFDTTPGAIPTVQLATATELPAVVPAVQHQQVVVLDMGWTNERLDIPAAIEAGHVIDVTVSDVRTASGSCEGVVFTVEQGVFQPNVDERAWVAELTRRGGPELQAWFAAEAARKEQIRREHYALAEQRRVEWAVQLEARREAVRAAAAELAQKQEAERLERARVETATATTLVQQQEAERLEHARVATALAQQEEAVRVAEAAHREEVRQAHYAEYERRKAARVEVNVQAVAISPRAPANVEHAAMVVPTSTVTASHEEDVHVSVAGFGAREDVFAAHETSVHVSAVAVVSEAVSAPEEWSTPSTVSLQAQPVSREDVAAVNVTQEPSTVGVSVEASGGVTVAASQEWSTPTFSRVAVSTEVVGPPGTAPCAPPPQPQVQVVEHQVDPAVVAAVHFFGALFGMMANAPPPVHSAGPATPVPPQASAPPAPRPPPPTIR